jgi:hypothetical protein
MCIPIQVQGSTKIEHAVENTEEGATRKWRATSLELIIIWCARHDSNVRPLGS